MTERDPRTRRMLGGVAIMATLLAGVLVILSLDDLTHGGEGTFTLVGVFGDAPGVQSGTPVWVAGKEVGAVTSVSFLPPAGVSRPGETRRGTVALRLHLPTELSPLLRRDSDIRLGPPRPLAPSVVRILPGSASAPPLQEGDTLWADEAALLRPLTERVRGLLTGTDTLLEGVDRIATMAGRRRVSLAPLAERADRLSAELRTLDREVHDGPAGTALRRAELTQGVRRLGERIDSMRSALRGFPATGEAPLREWSETLSALETRVTDVESLLATLDSLNGSTEGTLGRLRADSALTQEVARARAALDSLFAEIRAAPQRLFF